MNPPWPFFTACNLKTVHCLEVGLAPLNSVTVLYFTSIKNNCLKLKNEVGMAVLKSKQTRVVYRDNQHIRV